MIKNFDAVIFDLDGTLIDSMWIWRAIDIDYLGRFNIEIPDDLQDSIEGMSFSETAQYFKNRFRIPDSIDTIKKHWNEMTYDIYEKKVKLKPGAMEFLDILKKLKIKTGIATSNSRELASLAVRSRGIWDKIGTIVTGCDVNAGKPNPDVYLKAAENLNADPKKCLIFEDIPQGILAGRNAGMTTCAIEDDYSIKLVEQKKQLADFYIKDFYEFIDNYIN